MKKFFVVAMAALALLSCKKNDESNKPSVKWEGNTSFAEQEIGATMDAKVVLSFPEGLSILQIKCTTLPLELKGIVSPWIGIQANKAAMLLDLQDDATLAAAWQGKYATPIGNALKKASSCTIDFGKLLNDLTDGQVLAAGSKFVFDIMLTDAKGASVNRQARFKWTPAPEFPAGIPATYALMKNDTRTLEWSIKMAGKTEAFTIELSGSKADAGILSYVKQRNDNKTIIDLVNDANVQTAFGLTPVAKGATATTLKLTNLMKEFGYVATAGSETVMIVKITDQLGKSSQHVMTLSVAQEQ